MPPSAPVPSPPLHPAVLVLPAFGAEDFSADTTQSDELVRWLDAYDLDGSLEIPGANAPVRFTEPARPSSRDAPATQPSGASADQSAGTAADQPGESTAEQPAGLAVTTTGMGKTEAATTVSALCTSPAIDLEDTTVVTVGIAGGPPELPVGSVVVAESVVDWDLKHRFDPGTRDPPIDLLSYRPSDYVWDLDAELVSMAVDAVDPAELDRDAAITDWRANRGSDALEPVVETGVSISGDEFWHGAAIAAEAAWLCEQYDRPAYRRTEMEDAATAAALDRHDRIDQYVSVRAIANYDRPVDDVTDEIDDAELELGLENAFRAGRQVVDDLLADPPNTE